MKNVGKRGILSAAILLFAVLCAAAGDEEILEIKERMFIQQCNDIFFNTDEYVGKTVRLEGIYKTFRIPDGNSIKTSHYVYRNSPGCCGNDGESGFIVLLEDFPAPEQNAWVEATGKVEVTAVGMPMLRLSSLKVMETRGAEFVRK